MYSYKNIKDIRARAEEFCKTRASIFERTRRVHLAKGPAPILKPHGFLNFYEAPDRFLASTQDICVDFQLLENLGVERALVDLVRSSAPVVLCRLTRHGMGSSAPSVLCRFTRHAPGVMHTVIRGSLQTARRQNPLTFAPDGAIILCPVYL